MPRLAAALALLFLTTSTTAFCPGRTAPRVSVAVKSTPFFAGEETDYDAPVLADPQSGTAVLENEPVVDDECYMGKDGDFDDCVDFDPPMNPRRQSRSFNAMDGERAAPSWTVAFDDFDAPVLANPQSGTTVLANEPVVDDECYTGKDGDFDDCVDFDPPRLPRAPYFAAEDDFDAPVPIDPQSGTTVLASEPIVDDECYMGKDGDFDDCVDFDPPMNPRRASRSFNAMDGERAAPSWTQAGLNVP